MSIIIINGFICWEREQQTEEFYIVLIIDFININMLIHMTCICLEQRTHDKCLRPSTQIFSIYQCRSIVEHHLAHVSIIVVERAWKNQRQFQIPTKYE